MDINSEMFLMTKFKYLKKAMSNMPVNSLINNVVKSVNTNSLSKEELKKLEAEEKRKQKELKAKKMAELCKPKEENMKLKKFEEKEKFVNPTPIGEKKDLKIPMEERYNPESVECSWDSYWTKEKIFEVSTEKAKTYPKDKIFTMLLPPPNVTGTLHLGHTLMGAIQDSITRWKRMSGYCALWSPGTDHAGISCQTVVEKKLLKEENLMRKDMSREDFLKRVWMWKDEYGGKIFEQFRRLGVSFDWSRMYFTLDEERSKAVVDAFINLFERGILYRDKKIVHWCCTLRTAISDIEIEEIKLKEPTMLKVPGYKKEVEFGVMIDFSYKLKDDPNQELIISTTRIETMLGDVAVAVHPDDKRYQHLIGKKLVHPFFPDREMPIIADSILVDMNMGTGCVKITPAHDPFDFLCGKRNNLPFIIIMDDDGNMNQEAGKFAGMKRYECREKIQEELKKLGLYKNKKSNEMVLNLCSKTSDVIEPMLKPQWWVNCKDVADRAIKDVEEGRLKLVPEFHKQTWDHFLLNIREWCISRQLWWGHRCPAYLVTVQGLLENPNTENNNHWVAARNMEEALEKASKKFNVDKSLIKLTQDEDVLDTWFSSGLLPLSIFGFPDTNKEDYNIFFPSTLLETGHDILFFWVARMVFFGYFFADKCPFETVYLHPIVRDSQGRKMSKSLGNVIDPLEVIDGISLEKMIENLHKGNLAEKELKTSVEERKKEFPNGIPACGSDALRIGLLSYMNQGRDINLSVDRVISFKGFGNKLWNACSYFLKFAIADCNFVPNIKLVSVDNKEISFIDRWILHKLSKSISVINESMENYMFGDAVSSVYSLWKDYICDIYIEAIKPIFKSNDEKQKEITRNVLYFILIESLKILHPMAPFITEELYQKVTYEVNIKTNVEFDPKSIKSICIADFPTNVVFISDYHENLGIEMEKMAHKILSMNNFLNLKNKDDKIKKIKHSVTFVTNDKLIADFINSENLLIATLSKIQDVKATNDESILPKENLKVVLDDRIDIYFDLTYYSFDKLREIKRLEAEIVEVNSFIKDLNEKMTVDGYEDKASTFVKNSNIEKMKKFKQKYDKLESCIQFHKNN